MQNLPSAEVYAKEINFMPWGKLIEQVEKYLIQNIPQGGTVVDLLCGVGHLAGSIKSARPDINMIGVDLEPEYIEFARREHSKVTFYLADAFNWRHPLKPDVIICTAGLHHIEHYKQTTFVQNISTQLNTNGFAIIADPYIGNYTNEKQRKLASAKLGYEYLRETIENGATDDVIRASIDLIPNDIFLAEYKISTAIAEKYFSNYFLDLAKHKVWPEHDTDYGDYWYVLKQPKSN
jgi:2-polyprenyl-3-methyl-5-hydroxy-6-metoxy-1,4-benzoquinol methylase